MKKCFDIYGTTTRKIVERKWASDLPVPKRARREDGATLRASSGCTGPAMSFQRWIAFSACSSNTTTGPEDMKFASSLSTHDNNNHVTTTRLITQLQLRRHVAALLSLLLLVSLSHIREQALQLLMSTTKETERNKIIFQIEWRVARKG